MPKVKEIMRKAVITVRPEHSVSDVAKLLAKNKVGSAVVLRKERPVGIVTAEDIVAVVAKGKNPRTLRVRQLPRKEFVTTVPDADIVKTARLMVAKGVKRLPVLAEGRLVGIISDKEILLTAPEMMDIMSERLQLHVERVAEPRRVISGLCEECEGYSDGLRKIGGQWLCEDCRR